MFGERKLRNASTGWSGGRGVEEEEKKNNKNKLKFF